MYALLSPQKAYNVRITKEIIMYEENYSYVAHQWIKNQMTSLVKQVAIFKDQIAAEEDWAKLTAQFLPTEEDQIREFLQKHLNKKGVVKLKTTVRVYKKRQTDRLTTCTNLQCTLYAANSRKLDELVKISGKSKGDLINRLILDASLSDFAISTEEQLDLLD